MSETAPVLLVEVEDRIATMTLNRPDARNALSRALTLRAVGRRARGRRRSRRRRGDPHRRRPCVLRRRRPQGDQPARSRRTAEHRAAGRGPRALRQRALPVPPRDPEAGHRRDQRRRGHRRPRARAAVHVPRRVGARPLRRHPRPRRHHAGGGITVLARAVDRVATRHRDVAHRQLRDRRRGVRASAS